MRKEWEELNRGSKGYGTISNRNLIRIFGTQEEEEQRGGRGGRGGEEARQVEAELFEKI